MLRNVSIMGVRFIDQPMWAAIAQLRSALSGERPRTLFFANASTLNLACESDGYRETLNSACYVYGEAGDAGEAVVGIIAGSRLVMGDVGSGLEIDVSGDADLLTGDASTVDIDIAGPGDVVIGKVDGMLDVSIAGSGTVRGESLDGPMITRIAGSGAVSVKSGRADKLKAIIDGSGGVEFGGTAVQPELKLFGSAEVRMGAVSGRITRAGGGDVYVADKLVPKE